MEEIIRQNARLARSMDNQEALESPLFTTTPTANATPVAYGTGIIDPGWLPTTTVYGTGVANQIAFWSAPQTLTSSADFVVDTANNIMFIETGAAATGGRYRVGHSATSDFLELRHTSATQAQIQKFVSSGLSLIDIDPLPGDGTSAASFRFFRSTNTSGSVAFQVFLGDGTGTVNCQFAGNANSYVCANNSDFGVGINAPTTRMHVLETDAVTNAVTNVALIAHYSTGTPAAGFGAGLSFQLESSTTNARDSGRITSLWATATDASRAARMVFTCYYTTTERECMRIEADSANPLIGFLGATAVARQTVSGNNGGVPALTSFLTAVETLGLITDSTSNSATIPTGTGASPRIAYWSGASTLTSDSTFVWNSSQLGLNVASPSAVLHTVLNNAATTSYTDIAYFDHNTSGTPGTGYGSSILFRLESSTTVDQNAARFIVHWTTATHASRAVKGALTAYYTSTERECIAWGADASSSLVGFLGATPVARQTVGAASSDLATVITLANNMRTAGINLGLFQT